MSRDAGALRRAVVGTALAAALGSNAVLLLAPASAREPGAATPGGPAAAASGAEAAALQCTAEHPWPARFVLHYDVTAARGPLSLDGQNELSFSLDGGRYQLRSATRSALYKAQQLSRGTLDAGVLRPHEYSEQSRRGPSSTSIDWERRVVSFSANVDGSVPAVPQLQDRLSMLLQLGREVRRGQALAVEFQVAGVRHVSRYRFDARGEEPVSVPAGVYPSVRLQRDEDNDTIDVWLAPSLCWLPVRLRFADEHGLTVESRLRRVALD